MYDERPGRLPGVTVWRAVTDGESRVLPDGCMDLIWMHHQLVVAGPDTVAHLDTGPAGSVAHGLRFLPGALPDLLGVPASELVDRRVGLGDVLAATGAPGRGDAAVLEDRMEGCDVPSTSLEAVVLELARRRAGPPTGSLELPAMTAELAARIAAGEAVSDIAAAVGLSERQLRRRCMHLFGYGPATLRRVLRMQAALTAARAGVPLATAAVGHGYADQAHFNRDVKALAGVSAGALISS